MFWFGLVIHRIVKIRPIMGLKSISSDLTTLDNVKIRPIMGLKSAQNNITTVQGDMLKSDL